MHSLSLSKHNDSSRSYKGMSCTRWKAISFDLQLKIPQCCETSLNILEARITYGNADKCCEVDGRRYRESITWGVWGSGVIEGVGDLGFGGGGVCIHTGVSPSKPTCTQV